MGQVKRGFDWFSLVVGVLFLCGAWFVLTRPDRSLLALSIMLGIIAVIDGIYKLFFRYDVNRLVGTSSPWLLWSGILDIIIGILILWHPVGGALFLAYFFAIWFVIDSCVELATANLVRSFNKGYYILVVILAIISIILGIVLLFNPLLSASVLIWLIGFYLIAFGIDFIVKAF